MNLENNEKILLLLEEIGLMCHLTGHQHLIDLNDPKILPCGSYSCYKCIKKTRSFTKKMDCFNCKGVHYIKSVSSLPTNKDLNDIFKRSFVNLLNSSSQKWSEFSNMNGWSL